MSEPILALPSDKGTYMLDCDGTIQAQTVIARITVEHVGSFVTG